jgi:GrpB-like predicted nucleotidyltransferase (UPF0157 family)
MPRRAHPRRIRMLALRDHLRTHSADRELYARVKRDLATRDRKHIQHSPNAQTEAVNEILSVLDSAGDQSYAPASRVSSGAQISTAG